MRSIELQKFISSFSLLKVRSSFFLVSNNRKIKQCLFKRISDRRVKELFEWNRIHCPKCLSKEIHNTQRMFVQRLQKNSEILFGLKLAWKIPKLVYFHPFKESLGHNVFMCRELKTPNTAGLASLEKNSNFHLFSISNRRTFENYVF